LYLLAHFAASMLPHLAAPSPAPAVGLPHPEQAVNKLYVGALGLINILVGLLGAAGAVIDVFVIFNAARAALGHVWREDMASSFKTGGHALLVLAFWLIAPAGAISLSNSLFANVSTACGGSIPGFVQPTLTAITVAINGLEGISAGVWALLFMFAAGMRMTFNHLPNQDLNASLWLGAHAIGNAILYSSPAILIGVLTNFGINNVHFGVTC